MDKKLIAFDVEGIILPKAAYLLKLFIENKPGKILNLLSIGLQYYIRLISLETAIKNIFQYLKGLQEEILVSTIKEIELKPGVAQLFNDLRLKGYTLALITSGIPQQALDYLGEILPADYAVGPKVLCSDGKLSGEIKGKVIDEEGKKDALKSIIEQNSLTEYRIISIADDRNNISLFQMSDLSIGYRPDFFITLYSDRITKGNLRDLLPLIDGSEPEKRGLKPSTILRKIFHSSGILIPLFLTKHIDPHIVAALLIFFTIIYFVSEIWRYLGRNIPLISWFTLANTIEIEASEFVDAPIYFALGIAFSLILFPSNIASAAIAVLTLGDPLAMIIGTLYGKTKTPIPGDKTMEGFLAFIIASFLGCLFFIKPFESIICSVIGAVTEVIPTPLDDNLLIPLVSGLTLLLII